MPRLVVGKNDLETYCKQNPEVLYLLKEWDEEKNEKTSQMVSCMNAGKYWWKCRKCGHQWQARVADRTGHKSGCPMCNYYRQTSQHEQTFYYYIKQVFKDAVSSYRAPFLGKREIDIYIPSLLLGIEYDGRAWHSNPKKDYEKSAILKDNNIRLIRIREDSSELDDGSEYIHVPEKATSSNTRYLKDSIVELFDLVNRIFDIDVHPDVDIDRDNPKILAFVERVKKEKSIASMHPIVADEWDYEKNFPLTPDYVADGSKRYVWWKCKLGHSYYMAIGNRTAQGQSCPYCSGKKVLPGFNDLATIHPSISKEWDYEKNKQLRPSDVLACSGKKVWWKCSSCGNRWSACISNRVYGTGCPSCALKASRETLKGVNNPMFGLTGKDNPNSIPICAFTKKGVFVAEYEGAMEAYKLTGISNASISGCLHNTSHSAGGYIWRRKSEVVDEQGSIKKQIEVERKDLEFLRPDVVLLWHPTKNGNLLPEMLTVSSAKFIWLQCPKGHEWHKRVFEITRDNPIRCPICEKEEKEEIRRNREVPPGQISFDFDSLV